MRVWSPGHNAYVPVCRYSAITTGVLVAVALVAAALMIGIQIGIQHGRDLARMECQGGGK